MILILAGFLLLLFGAVKGAERAEGGGVILIGPFPIAFGTSEGIAKLMLAVGISLAIFFVLLNLFLR
mgnify:CR=1 FL=1